jgi:hypothetical protein
MCQPQHAQTPRAAATAAGRSAAAAPGWPHPIPARIKDGANPDLFVMTLGDVTTALVSCGEYRPH